MTPEERNLINELFDRLATLEDAERDPEAERAIKDGLRRAPNAPYALVQTVLVQDEALKRAQQRIDELEAQVAAAGEPSRPTSFLDRARDGVWGRRDAPRAGSVPSVPPVRPPDAAMGAPAGYGYGAGAQPMGGPGPAPQGGSFLGTAAAAAAGVIGGSMLMSGLRSMTGQAHAGHGLINPGSAASGNPATPWGDASGGKLAHDAGLDDIGRSPSGGSGTENSGEGQRQGLFDDSADPAGEDNDQDENEGDFDDDGGGDDGGDGDGP